MPFLCPECSKPSESSVLNQDGHLDLCQALAVGGSAGGLSWRIVEGEAQGQTWVRPPEAKGKSVRAGLHAGVVDFLLWEKRVFNCFVCGLRPDDRIKKQ